MERWVGKIAVVTGASAGVGASIAVQLVKSGLNVVGVARRVKKVQKLQSQVVGATGKLYPLQGDVSSEEDIKKIFKYTKETFGTIHVLVNNAGFMISGRLIDGEPSDWKKVLDVNVLGLAACSKEAVNLMRDTGVHDGHIININSLAGHKVPPFNDSKFNIYSPSKFAVTAISETLRHELRAINTKIRVTNLSPSYIKTEFEEVAIKNTPADKEFFDEILPDIPPLYPADLSEAVVYILSAPPHVQVHELLLTAI